MKHTAFLLRVAKCWDVQGSEVSALAQ